LGIVGYAVLPKQLLPVADRNQFAVEITLPTGSSLQRTTAIADSLEHILRRDSMIVSVASFKGASSPRFHTAYAPQLGGSNFAQFIVNTRSPKATEEMLDKYQEKYAEAFPGAYVRFKQLAYRLEVAPIEIRVSGSDLADLHRTADSIVTVLRAMPELELVRTDMNEPLRATEIELKEDEASRLLVTNADVELSTALRYNSDGIPLATVWNGDYGVSVKLKGDKADLSTPQDVADERIATYAGLGSVPLRQVADINPAWHYGQINHRNGLRTVSILAEHVRNANTLAVTDKVKQHIANIQLPHGVRLEYGGNLAENEENNPKIMRGLSLAVVIIFFILLAHFRQVRTALLLLVSLLLVILGAVAGTAVIGVEWGVTSTLGIISLMGILVRNAIIMYDYAEVLRETEHLTAHEAIYESAKRRMRPIFLTSAAASMGVIPMIVGGSSLWMPMGSVIFFGTLITMVLILTMLPIGYWFAMSGTTEKRNKGLTLEKE
jgi:multidrug efflux pump subunit AcrB